MAAPSPWRWPFSYAATPSLYSATIFPLYYTKNRLLLPYSPNFNSSSCCYSFNDYLSNARKRLRRKSPKTITVSENNEVFNSSLNSGVFNGKKFSFKSLFGKRALWRRIFFASQKVRSIILLNVITIIYGKVLKLVFFCYYIILISLFGYLI